MQKGVPNKRYTGEFKQLVVEMVREENLSYKEAMRQFDIGDHHIIQRWERIYLEEGPEGLYIERPGRCSKGRPPKLDKQAEIDLIAENQRLRAEVAYLKTCKPWFWNTSDASAKKTQVTETLRPEFSPSDLLPIAQIPRAP